MTVYMVGYDLMKPNHDYKSIDETIKSLGDSFHCLDSTWLVVSDKTPLEIRDILSVYLHKNGKMLVMEVGKHAAGKGFDDQETKWLKTHL